MALLKATLILLPFLAFYLYRRLRWHRYEQFKAFVSPPVDLLWGHAKLINEYQNDPTKTAGRHSGKPDSAMSPHEFPGCYFPCIFPSSPECRAKIGRSNIHTIYAKEPFLANPDQKSPQTTSSKISTAAWAAHP